MTPDRWTGWGASCTGPEHRRLQLPNQDAWLRRRLQRGELCVVSDGLGSRAMSHLGARAACHAAWQAARAFGQPEDASATAAFLARLHAAWLEQLWPLAADECAATCLIALRLDGALLLAQLGDGMAAVCMRNGQAAYVLTPAPAGDFSNITDCLRAAHVPAAWRWLWLSAAEAAGVVLCTDGIADDLAPGQLAPFAAALLADGADVPLRRQRRKAQQWLERWPVAGHTDDKTIVCMFAPEEQDHVG